MSELPSPRSITKETPVLDPRAFVLHWENEAYLKGKRPQPYIGGGEEDLVAAFLSVAAFFCLMAGGGCLGMMAWFTNPKRRNAKLNGRVLMGEVLESEKIRGYRGESHLNGIGVRYQFTTPGGKVIRDRAEATNDRSREKMVPAPESPVYIWYDDDGNYTLL